MILFKKTINQRIKQYIDTESAVNIHIFKAYNAIDRWLAIWKS